jgi:DNA-binding CsgD family transcriptional regulator
MSRQDTISVIEAAYAVAEPEDAWLSGLMAAAEPELADRFGLCAYTYDATRTPLRIGTLVSSGPPELSEVARGAVAMASTNVEYVNRTWRALSFATVSETVDIQNVEAARGFVEAGMNDILVVNAYDPSGFGVWLGAPLAKARRPEESEKHIWHRVASHISTALRLRARCASPAPSPAAILSTTGRVEHAEGEATVKSARVALRDAVVAMERARGPKRVRDPETAVCDWRAMVDARWSLLDRFESGGRRYIVAMQNEPFADGPELLAPREKQVLAAAATGRSNKVIAYELGLGDSTIRVLLGRVMRKLGVHSRREAIAVYVAHSQAGHR